MGDISLQLAAECLKNSRDVVGALPKIELSSDIQKAISDLKSIIELEEKRQRPTNKDEKYENGEFRQPHLETFILSARQFSCLRDLIKQSMDMIDIHIKQCQITHLNNTMSSNQTSPYFKEEISPNQVKLEDEGQVELELNLETQDLPNVINTEKQIIEFHDGIDHVDFGLYQRKFADESSVIQEGTLTDASNYEEYSTQTDPGKSRKMKRKYSDAKVGHGEKKKRRKIHKVGRKKSDDERNQGVKDNKIKLDLSGDFVKGN